MHGITRREEGAKGGRNARRCPHVLYAFGVHKLVMIASRWTTTASPEACSFDSLSPLFTCLVVPRSIWVVPMDSLRLVKPNHVVPKPAQHTRISVGFISPFTRLRRKPRRLSAVDARGACPAISPEYLSACRFGRVASERPLFLKCYSTAHHMITSTPVPSLRDARSMIYRLRQCV